MAKYLTDISLENGYAEAIIIVGDSRCAGVGGFCQVSTTLFRTAFFAGSRSWSGIRMLIASAIMSKMPTAG
jgi:vancomycin resistance protein YoaR